MILKNHPKPLGIILIISSIPFFSYFLMMFIPVILRPEGLTDGEMVYILQIFFFDTASILFHYPAFVLIILGIYFLIIKKNNEISK
jgi:hypothetical protein